MATFLIPVIKWPARVTEERKGSFDSQSEGPTQHGLEAMAAGLVTAVHVIIAGMCGRGHIGSVVRKWRGVNAGSQLAFPFLCVLVLPSVRVALPASAELISQIPLRQAQKFFFFFSGGWV